MDSTNMNIDGAVLNVLDCYRDARDAAVRLAERHNDAAALHEVEAARNRAISNRLISQVNEDVPVASDEGAGA